LYCDYFELPLFTAAVSIDLCTVYINHIVEYFVRVDDRYSRVLLAIYAASFLHSVTAEKSNKQTRIGN